MNPDPGPRSALDERLDDAARRVDDHVGDYVTPRFDPSARPPRRSSSAAATAVAAALLLIVGIVAFGGDDPDGGVEATDSGPEISSFDEVGEAVGGPRDGLDSLRLPIEVTPADGLADGQVVTVRGSQFPPVTSLGVVMCIGYVNREPAGSANCRLSPYTAVTSDENGNFSVDHAVDRVFTTSGGEQVDCAEANADWTCIVAVGALADYDQSGIAPVSFDPAIPALPDPFVTLDPLGPYGDGQQVTLTIGNVSRGAQYDVQLCVDDRGSYACIPIEGSPLLTDGNGFAQVSVTLARKVDVGFGPVDCGAGEARCYIDVYDPYYGYSLDLQFVGAQQSTTDTSIVSEPPPPPPTVPTTTTVPGPQEKVPTATTAPSTTTTQGSTGGTIGG